MEASVATTRVLPYLPERLNGTTRDHLVLREDGAQSHATALSACRDAISMDEDVVVYVLESNYRIVDAKRMHKNTRVLQFVFGFTLACYALAVVMLLWIGLSWACCAPRYVSVRSNV